MHREVSNQTDYFSRHYVAYGLSIQAMCDPDLVFMYVAVAGPGKINDSRAFSRCTGLIEWFETAASTSVCSIRTPPTRNDTGRVRRRRREVPVSRGIPIDASTIGTVETQHARVFVAFVILDVFVVGHCYDRGVREY
jgi:hypothetical protein